MMVKKIFITALSFCLACGCAKNSQSEFYNVERFADLQILRYKVPEFEELSLQQKMLVYYLAEAALEGRDILFDQNGKHNLTIRKTLETIYGGGTVVDHYGFLRSSAHGFYADGSGSGKKIDKNSTRNLQLDHIKKSFLNSILCWSCIISFRSYQF